MGTHETYFTNLTNEERLVLADIAACKAEELAGKKLTPDEYERFVWEFITTVHIKELDSE